MKLESEITRPEYAQGQHSHSLDQADSDFNAGRVDDQTTLLGLPKHHSESMMNPMNIGRVPKNPPLLLKPTGAPVFQSLEAKSNMVEQMTTMDQTFQMTKESGNGSAVRVHSFVAGKKLSNITSLNLLTAESGPQPGEEGFMPIKVIYQKPGAQPKSSSQPPGYQAPTGTQPPKIQIQKPARDVSGNQKHAANDKLKQVSKPAPEAIHLKKNLSRPKSAADQPAKSVSAPKLKLVKKAPEPQPEVKEEKKAPASIPFAENRLKGQYSQMTEELFSKAQKALKEQKLQEEIQKAQTELKKEQLKAQQDEIKQKNAEMIQRQKEKGLQHIDFRKKEEEAKEQARKDENMADREKQRQLREQRKVDSKRQLGLDLIDEDFLEVQRKKAKETLDTKVKPIVAKGGVIAPISSLPSRPKSSQPQKSIITSFDRYNNDLSLIMNNKENLSQNGQSIVPLSEEEKLQQELDQKRARQEVLKEQQRKRKEKKLQEEMEAEKERKKKEDAMNRLTEQLQQNKIENLKRQEEAKRKQEEEERRQKIEKELRLQEKKAKFGKKLKANIPSQGDLSVNQRVDKTIELHDWIDEQLANPTPPIDLEEVESPPRIKEVKVSAKKDGRVQSAGPSVFVKEEGAQKKQYRMNPNQSQHSSGMDLEEVIGYDQNASGSFYQVDNLPQPIVPGNSELDLQEFNKLGHRQNRYGIFGDNGYQDAVEISKRPQAQIVKVKAEPVLSQEGISSAFQKIQEFHLQKLEQHKQKLDLHQDYSFTDPTLVKPERRILNEIQKQYFLNFHPSPDHTQSVPGVVNIQSEVDRQKQEDLASQTKAVRVIQKWARGLLGRCKARRVRERRQGEIDAQYGYFNSRVKNNADYHLKQFIRDKEVLREKNKTKSVRIAESDSIVERIEGMSTSLNNRVPIMSKIAGSQSMDRKQARPLQNNFMQPPTSYDQYSIINIMLQRQQQPKPAAVQSPIKLMSNKEQQQALSRSKERPATHTNAQKKPSKEHIVKPHQRHSKDRRQSNSSEIEEEIAEDIPQEEGLSNRSSAGDDSIVDEVGSNKLAGSLSESHSKEIKEEIFSIKSSFQQLRNHKPFNYKMQTESISESIKEDFLLSVDNYKRGSPGKKAAESGSYDKDSSIAEESHLIQASESRASSAQRKYGSGHIEEDIEDLASSGQNSTPSEVVLPKKKPVSVMEQHEIEKAKTMEQIRKFEEERKAGQEKKSQLISEMLHELNRYESANVSQIVVERMEKVITKSLAQKDQLLVAQRLHELEQEAKHQEEIARIREEQMKLMAQLLMAGSAGGQSEQQRKEMMENIQKIIDKPVTYVQPSSHPSSIPQNNSSNENSKDSSSKLKHSTSYGGGSQSIKDSIKLDIIEESGLEKVRSEIDEEIPDEVESKNMTSSDDIKESVHPAGQINEDSSGSQIQEESHLANVRKAIGSEKDIRANSKKVIKGKDGKEKQEGMFSKNSFHEFQEKKFKEYLTDGSDVFFQRIETQLETYKDQAYQELDSELKRNMLTPRTYRKKGEEIEKWADRKKRELIKQVEPLNLHLKSIMDNLVKDKEAIIDKIGVSPRQHPSYSRSKDDTSSIDIEEEQSDESQNTKFVRDQITRLARKNNYVEEGLDVSESAKMDLKIKKKKALAKKLIDEKEKIIKQGIKYKQRNVEAAQAEQMVSLALRIDPNAEIEKRLREMKRQIDESSEQLESARLSQSGAPSEGKKKVQFASPEKYRSSGIEESSVSNRYSNSKIEDSIGESISIQESYQSTSKYNGEQSQDKKSSSLLKPPVAIKEELAESSNYSEDYLEESKRSHSTPNRQRLSNYERSATESHQIPCYLKYRVQKI